MWHSQDFEGGQDLWKPEDIGQVLERRIILVATSEELEKLGLLYCKGNGFMPGTSVNVI